MPASARQSLFATLLAVILLSLLATNACALPIFAEVKAAHRRSDAQLLDRRGELLHELRIDKSGRRLDWVALKGVSPLLVKAVLQSEDWNFYGHGGIDWKSVGAAAVGRLFGSKNRGASTISMQLAVMLKT